MLYFLFSKTFAAFRLSNNRNKELCGGHRQQDCANRVMSPRRLILLLIFYIAYLMFGASIYYHIEHALEKQSRANDLKERIEINKYLVDELEGKSESTINSILTTITDYCGKSVKNYTEDEFEAPYTWTFYHSFFFAFTVCSTVGYGNLYPTTTAGRIIMIFYSIIGIPVNGILFAGLGEYFGKTFELIYRRYKEFKMSQNKHYVPPQLGLITAILIALIPGIGIFILLPALVFTYFESWSYSVSVYFAYVTTTTIGFGDYVPTFGKEQPREFGAWFVVYEIFIIFWFIFALGYLVMIMGFITRGLQSKKLRRLEQQLSTNIKTTQNRIWTGVTKDVGHLRRILNELYILRVKPVYTEPDEEQILHRSNSAPELTMYRVDPPIESPRKRAFSESYDVVEARGVLAPIHASSDTELDKLDKQKSFQDADAFLQTTELLAKVVNALGAVRAPAPEEDDASLYGGYHGFSDSQILASEWSYPSVNEVPKPRGRANSDYNFEPPWRQRRPTMLPNEWTWSGDNERIQEAINNRYKQGDNEDLYRSSFGLPPRDYVVNMEEEEPQKPRVKKFSMPDGLRKLFPSKKRSSQERITAPEPNADIAMPNGGRRFSIMSVPENARRTPPLDYNSTVAADANAPNYVNGKPAALPAPPSSYPSDGSLTSKQPTGVLNGMAGGARRGSSALAVSGTRKRRESIFTQNPALGARRGSLFPTSNAAGLTQRRGSTAAAQTGAAPQSRRGSLFPTSGRGGAAGADRRPSLFSVASEEERDVLENTTIADLIRALEVLHTQTAMEEAGDGGPVITHSDMGGIFGSEDKPRKKSIAALDLPDVPPLFSLLGSDNKRAMNAAAANRLYARRSTVVGALPTSSFNTPTGSTTALAPTSLMSSTGPTSVLTRRRKSSAVQQVPEPPPSYTERDTNAPSATNASNKFKRRFSVRPTALQIPPGKAPPPGAIINSVLQPQASATASALPPPSSSQSVMPRRLSLRPSPLARELNISTTPSSTSSSGDPSPTSPSSSGATVSSTTRLLPANTPGTSTPMGAATRPPSTGSTHSPLSRIVQITQAQRKISKPEGFPLERTQKPDDI